MPAEEYRPAWCPHVVGRFDRELDEDGKPEPTVVRMTCEKCGATHRMRCESGAPRQWVLKFASSHVHRDPMKVSVPKQGGKGR